MRIIRGKLKSIRVAAPKGFDSRPTTNFAKEGLFNVIDNHFDIDGKEILDLCCGTGSITLEFISAEAKEVVAVDKNFACTQYLKHTARDLKISDQLTIVKSEVLSYLKKCERKFDMIFADPPYDLNIHADILAAVVEKKMLNPDGWLIIEHGKKTTFGLIEPDFQRKYGAVIFSFFDYDSLPGKSIE